jgi:hypothetical protein
VEEQYQRRVVENRIYAVVYTFYERDKTAPVFGVVEKRSGRLAEERACNCAGKPVLGKSKQAAIETAYRTEELAAAVVIRQHQTPDGSGVSARRRLRGYGEEGVYHPGLDRPVAKPSFASAKGK